jgi:hypothetical protein
MSEGEESRWDVQVIHQIIRGFVDLSFGRKGVDRCQQTVWRLMSPCRMGLTLWASTSPLPVCLRTRSSRCKHRYDRSHHLRADPRERTTKPRPVRHELAGSIVQRSEQAPEPCKGLTGSDPLVWVRRSRRFAGDEPERLPAIVPETERLRPSVAFSRTRTSWPARGPRRGVCSRLDLRGSSGDGTPHHHRRGPLRESGRCSRHPVPRDVAQPRGAGDWRPTVLWLRLRLLALRERQGLIIGPHLLIGGVGLGRSVIMVRAMEDPWKQ